MGIERVGGSFHEKEERVDVNRKAKDIRGKSEGAGSCTNCWVDECLATKSEQRSTKLAPRERKLDLSRLLNKAEQKSKRHAGTAYSTVLPIVRNRDLASHFCRITRFLKVLRARHHPLRGRPTIVVLSYHGEVKAIM